jgi:RNA polymerase sigma-70 factor (ECF subfamily)
MAEATTRTRRAGRGAPEDLEATLERYRAELTAYAYRMLGSAFEAEDAVQETFIRARRALPRFRAEATFSTWLYRICLNAVHDQRARAARGGGVGLDELAEPADPRDSILEAELSGELQQALAGLDETYRTAVVLYDVLGRSYAEISEVLGVPEGTVKSRIFRGRTELARRLGTVGAAGESEER